MKRARVRQYQRYVCVRVFVCDMVFKLVYLFLDVCVCACMFAGIMKSMIGICDDTRLMPDGPRFAVSVGL